MSEVGDWLTEQNALADVIEIFKGMVNVQCLRVVAARARVGARARGHEGMSCTFIS